MYLGNLIHAIEGAIKLAAFHCTNYHVIKDDGYYVITSERELALSDHDRVVFNTYDYFNE